mmetsp:Transcript_20635/g.36337  ORF Transcript_20635/g.36337 Transcript_20635/m.36337 type:complete len:240 (+) Transcript_20635:150-869(+)
MRVDCANVSPHDSSWPKICIDRTTNLEASRTFTSPASTRPSSSWEMPPMAFCSTSYTPSACCCRPSSKRASNSRSSSSSGGAKRCAHSCRTRSIARSHFFSSMLSRSSATSAFSLVAAFSGSSAPSARPASSSSLRLPSSSLESSLESAGRLSLASRGAALAASAPRISSSVRTSTASCSKPGFASSAACSCSIASADTSAPARLICLQSDTAASSSSWRMHPPTRDSQISAHAPTEKT